MGQEIIEEVDSYTEISPRGRRSYTGQGRTRREVNRKGRFEAYDQGRYFTVPAPLEGTRRAWSLARSAQNVVRRVLGEPSQNGHKVVLRPRPQTHSLTRKLSREREQLPTVRGSGACGPGILQVTQAHPKQTLRCVLISHSGPVLTHNE